MSAVIEAAVVSDDLTTPCPSTTRRLPGRFSPEGAA
jgi:hypothetical protein